MYILVMEKLNELFIYLDKEMTDLFADLESLLYLYILQIFFLQI